MSRSPRFPDRVTIEILASVGAGAPFVAVARWRRLCEVMEGETPELAVEAVMGAVRARQVKLAREGLDVS